MNLPFQKRIYLFPAGCLAFILFFTVFGDKGLLRIHELKKDKERIEANLSDTRNDNEKLKREIMALKTDRLTEAERTIVVYVDRLLDGHHRAVAAIKAKLPLLCVDVSELPA